MAVNNIPRILVISGSDILKDSVSYAYTFRSFASLIPESHIYQLICYDNATGIRGKINDHIFALNHEDIFIGNKYKRVELSAESFSRNSSNNATNGAIGRLKTNIRKYAKEIYSMLPYKNLSNLKSFIVDSQVSVIYTCSASPRCYNLLMKLSKEYSISVLPHILDDWPNVLMEKTPLLFPLRKLFLSRFSKLLRSSNVVLTACDLMSDGYSQRYGTNNFISLMHCVPNHEIKKKERYNSPIRIVYGGSLYLDRDLIIAQLSQKMSEIGVDKEFSINIYSSKLHWEGLKSSFDDCSNVSYKGSLSQEEMFDVVQNEADILLLPESFTEESLRYIRFSMSTKIPEYLSSGHPILAIGNKEQGSINYLLKNRAAYMINKESDFCDTIKAILSEKDKDLILSNSWNLFLDNHEKFSQSQKFLQAVITSCQ